MAFLLTYSEQQEIKPISLNNEDMYAQIASEVESLELNKLLGYAFYQAISEAPEDYEAILNETSFVDCDENTVKHKGLKYVIAYLNYAKYVGESYISDTFTGMVKKVRQDSESLSSGEVKRLQQDAREIAFNAFELIRMYLNKNKETYTLWNRTSDKKPYKPKFYGIKKTLG